MELEAEYIAARKQLIDAGVSADGLSTTAEIYQAIRALYEAAPDANESFVDRLRTMLEPALARAEAAELEVKFAEQAGLKGCPECHLEPEVSAKGQISCGRHGDEMPIGTFCRTYKESLVSWNEDGSWILLGGDPKRVMARPVFPFTPEGH